MKKKSNPESPSPSLPAFAESMASAAAMYGIPMAELKRAKRAGCTAFRGPRVHRNEIVEWLKENPSDDTGDPIEELKRQQLLRVIRNLDLQYEKEVGTLIPREQAKSAWASATQKIQDVLGKLLEKETYNAVIKEIQREIKVVKL